MTSYQEKVFRKDAANLQENTHAERLLLIDLTFLPFVKCRKTDFIANNKRMLICHPCSRTDIPPISALDIFPLNLSMMHRFETLFMDGIIQALPIQQFQVLKSPAKVLFAFLIQHDHFLIRYRLLQSCFKVIIISMSMLYKENHVGYILILLFISKRNISTSLKLN